MLDLLHIENIAVIEKADIEFRPGLNVLTGETGAGKSIVVDSISAVMGERTSRDILRTGAKAALVSASFSGLPELEWFGESGVSPEEGGVVTILRRMTADGKNSCRVNGVPVSLAQLKSLGKLLIGIHGQHDSLQLMDEGYHLSFLDLFSENEALREQYRAKFDEMNSIRGEIDALTMDEAAKARKAEMLQFQINELESAALVPGEDAKLKERAAELRNFGRIADAVNTAHGALNGGTDSSGALDMVYEAAESLRSLANISEKYSELASRLKEVEYLLEDCSREVSALSDGLEFSPQEQDEVESRLDQLHRLGKKYGADVEDMLRFLEDCKAELGKIQQSSDEIERLEKELNKAKHEMEALAALLTENRRKNAEVLRARILEELSGLDMGKLRFEIEIEPKEPDATGADQVRFLMSANAGETLKPISKIASGGELSRIILGMKNVLAEKEPITTMVFDEVDTGVSGRAALRVACKLAVLSSEKQVFCVTHLPQIAAMADTHFSVEKSEHDGRTFTDITALDREGRKRELARLSGGTEPTQAMLDSAEELIEYSERFKREIRT